MVVLAVFTSPLCEDERVSDKWALRFFFHYFSTGLYACENDDNYG